MTAAAEIARLQLVLRACNAFAAVLVTRAVLSHPDADVVSALLKAISFAAAVGLLELGIGHYLQVSLAGDALSKRASRRVQRFVTVVPPLATLTLTAALRFLSGTSGAVLACAGFIVASGAFGLGTIILNQLAFSHDTLESGVRQQIAAVISGSVLVLVAEVLGLPLLLGATSYYALVAVVGAWNALTIVRFLRSRDVENEQRDTLGASSPALAWYSIEALIDPVVIAGITFLISTEPAPERLRIWALLSRIINTVCALLMVAYLSLWRNAASKDAAPLTERITPRLMLALLSPLVLAGLLAATHSIWAPFFLRGQPYEWGFGELVLFVTLLGSRTFLNFFSVLAKIARLQHLTTSLSAFSIATGSLLVITMHARVHHVLVLHSALVIAATALTYSAVRSRFHEDRHFQSSP